MKLINKQYYKIDFKKLLLLLLPTFLRKSRLAAFISVLIAPIKEMYKQFTEQQQQDWYRLNHNGQVFSLRKVLNDHFDNELREIEIVDSDVVERVYIYTPVEHQPFYLNGTNENAKHIYTPIEHVGTEDFVVVVPPRVQFDIYQMRNLIDTYKLVTKRYKIEHNA